MNNISFFLTLVFKIYFTADNHIENCTVPEIFKAFKEVYQYYLHRGNRINTVNSDGEFRPLESLLESLQGGALVNLTASNEQVPNI